ncbi:hypothetical protein CAPTEDRAFT_188526 [Capitella teleta]|uniref:Uncharacterized protein n=1 Tax=Capitella teleta TaxID=283909 RepID=R7U6X5_CAPTE|nr:hypothetical protein CAPTEDRAFT_188526 [Capitella teleta]|eukprot:ELT99411.1 hypothetical protein CAPTEDRAFT_188526 [Capitella teleta]
MKLTSKVAQQHFKGPLKRCRCLDVSKLDIVYIDKLHSCPRLRSLILKDNSLFFISNIECLHELWKLDLSCNKVTNLDGLQRFIAIGSLLLSSNDIDWSELNKIRHLHILNLSLHGNRKLESDPHFLTYHSPDERLETVRFQLCAFKSDRAHVVDCLPNLWCLDGRIITSAEREQVSQFFCDSALTDRPVRHKLKQKSFTATTFKGVQITGVHGEKTVQFMRRFPLNGPLNAEMDKRRLSYLAQNVQEEVMLELESRRLFKNLSRNSNFLEDLLASREGEQMKCNMILLLLIASLEFNIPTKLMHEVLTAAKLANISSHSSNVTTMELFLLKKEHRSRVASLLLSSVKVENDAGLDGGLYNQLYVALYNAVFQLTKLAEGASDSKEKKVNKNALNLHDEAKCLIASEVVRLMCNVLGFYEYLFTDAGIISMVAMATGDAFVVEKLKGLNLEKEKGEDVYQLVADSLIAYIHSFTWKPRPWSTLQQENQVLQVSKALPRRPHTSILASDYHLIGLSCPERQAARIKSGRVERRSFIPKAQLGDRVLLGPQNVGRIISMPEPEMALVQMDIIPSESGAMISTPRDVEQRFTYLDMRLFSFDSSQGFWRQDGTVGDRITIQRLADKENREKVSVQLKSPHGQIPPPSTPKSARPMSVTHQREDPAATPVLQVGSNAAYQREADLPWMVAERYTQAHRIRLNEQNREIMNSDNPQYFPLEDVAPSHHKKPLRQHFQPHTEEDGDEAPPVDNLLYDRLLSAIKTFAHTSGEVSRRRWLKSEDSDQVLYQSEGHFFSRRSSLESADEDELKELLQESRPGTSVSQRSVLGVEHNPGQRIEMPSVPIEKSCESPDHSQPAEIEQAEERKFEPATHEPFSPVKVQLHVDSHGRPRPISAYESGRLARDSSFFTSYQDLRTEAWRDGTFRRFSARESRKGQSPPPQPPSSPYGKSSGRHIHVSVGDTWLAGGHDLHHREMQMRPRTAHVPGWKAGRRPLSGAHSLRRTPSKTQSPSQDPRQRSSLSDYYATDSASATHPFVPRGSEQFPGSFIQSHPRARTAFQNKIMESSVECEECRLKRPQTEPPTTESGGEQEESAEEQSCGHLSQNHASPIAQTP